VVLPVLQKRRLSGFLSLNISATTTSFDASLGYKKSPKRKLVKEWK
jgi:hypothetical protein